MSRRPAGRDPLPIRLIDTVLYGGSAGGAVWLVLTHLTGIHSEAALLLAALGGCTVAARVWRFGPPAWWLRAFARDTYRLTFRGRR